MMTLMILTNKIPRVSVIKNMQSFQVRSQGKVCFTKHGFGLKGDAQSAGSSKGQQKRKGEGQFPVFLSDGGCSCSDLRNSQEETFQVFGKPGKKLQDSLKKGK